MKKFTVILLTSLALNSFGQEEQTITKTNDKESLGCFVSFDTKISQMHGNYVLFTGIKMGAIIDHKHSIGLAFNELSGQQTFEYTDNLSNDYTFKNEVTYGGLFIGTSLLNKKPVHFLTSLLIGWGKMEIKDNVYLNQYYVEGAHNREYDYWAKIEESSFFVLEPGVNVEIDVLKWMRLGGGVSYRYVLGNNLNTLLDADRELSGFSLDINLKLGHF